MPSKASRCTVTAGGLPRFDTENPPSPRQRDARLQCQETHVTRKRDAHHSRKRRASDVPRDRGLYAIIQGKAKSRKEQVWGQTLRISYAILDQYPSDADQLVRVTSAMLSG